MSQPTSNPRRGRGAAIAGGIAAGAVVVLGGGYAAGYALAGDNVPRNAVVSGVPIGGLSSAAATAKLESELGPRLTKKVTITAVDQSLESTPADLGFGIDYPASVAQAGAGRSWDPGHIVNVLTGGSAQPAVLTRDQSKLDAALASLSDRLDGAPVDASLAVKDGKVVRSAGKDGTGLDLAKTTDALAFGVLDSSRINAVVTTVEPDVTTAEADEVLTRVGVPALASPIKVKVDGAGSFDLTPDSVGKALTFVAENGTLAPKLNGKALVKSSTAALQNLGLKQPKDATITIRNGKPKIIASVDGEGVKDTDLAAAAVAVLEQPKGRSVTVKASAQQAAFTTADAKKLGVKKVTGSFTTYFPGTAYRYNNLPKAARLINGTFLKPGETFSMNETLGYRSAANGWMAGGAIDGGKVVERMGGGISQATTTTFNAIFFAGLKDIYHKPHSLYFSRYPVGREATLDWVSVDMKFQNDSPYGVVLQAYTTGKFPNQGSITVKVWSTKVYTIKTTTPVRSNYRSPGPTQYDTSPKCVPQSAMSGFDVRFKRLFYKGKTLVKSEPFFWRYNTLTPVVCGKKPGT